MCYEELSLGGARVVGWGVASLACVNNTIRGIRPSWLFLEKKSRQKGKIGETKEEEKMRKEEKLGRKKKKNKKIEKIELVFFLFFVLSF
jgi:hypothetical protein